MTEKPQIRLAGMYFAPGAHIGGWRMPDAIPESDMGFEHYVRLAQTMERGFFDALFFQDIQAVPASAALEKGDTYGSISIRATCLEPMTLLPALATVTKHIGLIATASTTYNEPYQVARKFATLDHISGGRAGWNLVTSQNDNEAANFNRDEHLEHSKRYARAAEFHQVVTGLWDSWEKDAITRNKETGVYFDYEKLHILGHRGEHFQVRGPLNVARAPQGHPVIAQAGSSEPGRDLAARTADLVFTAQHTLADAQAFYRDIKERAARHGRDPSHIKILPGLNPIIGRTESEARAKKELLESLIPNDIAIMVLMQNAGGVDLRKYPLDGPLPDLPESNNAKGRQRLFTEIARRENLTLGQIARRQASGSGHLVVADTPKGMADLMEEWVRGQGADGFTILWPYYPTPVDDFVELVVPELQRRGIYRTEYAGRTLRENMGLKIL